MNRYPTNLTDKQWQVTENILDPQHRKRKYPLRDIMNAIMYILKTGCQWRMLPKDFPPHNTVFYYFNKWKQEGVLEELMDALHRMVRKLMGRKEHIVVDTLGLPMSMVVHEANVHDSVGADGVIDKMKGCFPRLKKMLADTRGRNCPIPYAKSSVRSLPLFSVRTSLRRNSPCCRSDGLWSALSPGWKTLEESPWITSSILIRARQWFNLPSADSCITNCAIKI